MNFTTTITGFPGTQVELITTGTAQSIGDFLVDGQGAISIMIGADSASARIRFDGGNPISGGKGFIVPKGGAYIIQNWKSILNLKVISENLGTPATLTIQPYYADEVK